jgi:hypothetical protein
MLQKIRNFFKSDSVEQMTYDYLSKSNDLVDLERRQRRIDLGQAPWQQSINNNLRGWV